MQLIRVVAESGLAELVKEGPQSVDVLAVATGSALGDFNGVTVEAATLVQSLEY
jgi:hypothetical protein